MSASLPIEKEALVIVDGVRTPFIKAGTEFKELSAVELGRQVVTALLARSDLDAALVDEVILGCVCQPADAANIARVVALRAGIPQKTPAATVHRNCGSGLEALTTAYERMMAGRGSIFIVGGVESMSNVPLFYRKSAVEKFSKLSRSKTMGQKLRGLATFRPKDFSPIVGLRLGLTDPFAAMNMGETAELLAREFRISREAQDAFALRSHEKATLARDRLSEEITPVMVPHRQQAVTQDNGIRESQSMEALAKLKPAFSGSHGTVTAGNASQITDGAAAMLVMTESKARELNLEPLGRLLDYAWTGCDPARMGLGPAFAIADLQARSGLGVKDAELVEINEAFSAQVLAVHAAMKTSEGARTAGLSQTLGEIPPDLLNVNGGAIALGHPVGVSGARLVLTSLRELRRRKAKRALVSMCIGGGQGGAAWLERL